MEKHISVACVSQSFLPYVGGLARYVEALGKQFLKNGHDFKVIHFKTASIGPIDFSSGIEMIRANVPKVGDETLAKYMKFKELILNVTHGEMNEGGQNHEGYEEYMQVNEKLAYDIMDAYRYKPFDILHVHDFQTLPLAHILKTRFDLRIPMVFTWHVPLVRDIPEWWKDFFTRYMSLYDRIVFSTDEYVEAAISIGLPKDSVVKISPFIDVSIYDMEKPNTVREKYGIKAGEFLILCVSRIDPRKGQEILIEAVNILVNSLGQKNLKCVFVGNGSFSKELLKKERSERLDKLIKMVEAKGLQDRVIFTGLVEERELCQLYDTSDLVVQPSLQEGFGLTISEAMVFSKPVIGSNVGGIPDQIKDGLNGYLFEKGNSRQLAEKILDLIRSPELRKKMEKAATSS